jgi:hypothetical protein
MIEVPINYVAQVPAVFFFKNTNKPKQVDNNGMMMTQLSNKSRRLLMLYSVGSFLQAKTASEKE